MSGRTIRSLGLGLVTTAGAGVLALTAMMNSAFAYGDVPPNPADPTIGLVMGPSGIPNPNFDLPGYVQAANNLYIHPNFPDTTYPGPYADGLSLPNYPLISVPFAYNYPDATTGPLAGFPAPNTSMGQGMVILDNAIATNMAAGDTSTVFGWSQSSTISSLVMEQLDPSGAPMPNDGLQFVLVGDPNAPNGGLEERFDGATLINGQTIPIQANVPSLGISFDGATPADSFPTDIYTLEYDGAADFPQYPINFLADLNALLGYTEIHSLYLNQGLVPPEPGPTAEQIANATLLQGSAALGTPDSLTNYYMIDQTPPLVSLLAGIPVIGKPLADLLGPDLTMLINLGYGNPDFGYSTGPANVPTPFGLFPNVDPTTLFNELATGAQQGFSAFEGDLSSLSLSSLVPAVSSAVAAVPAELPTITDIFNGIASASSSLSTLLLQTSDIADAALFTLPAYDATLFLDNPTDPLDAIGLPLAANTGLLTFLSGFEFLLVEQATTAITNDVTALIP
jgi:PE-PPE domain